ncbi:MAG: antitoxin family protein, partial [Desulfuromonadaceae bacterium]
MRQAITAVYENGMFIPTTKVDLPEHTTVMTAIAEKVSALATEKYL